MPRLTARPERWSNSLISHIVNYTLFVSLVFCVDLLPKFDREVDDVMLDDCIIWARENAPDDETANDLTSAEMKESAQVISYILCWLLLYCFFFVMRSMLF